MYAIIDMDNLVFLGRTEAYHDVRIIEETICAGRKEPLLVPVLDRKSDWTALTELEAMMLGEKYSLPVVISDYPGNLKLLQQYAEDLPMVIINQDQIDLFNAPTEALKNKYGHQETRPAAPRAIVERPKSKPQGELRAPSPKGATGRVWEIADNEVRLLEEQGDPVDVKKLRGRVIEICVENGIHPATAATQWSKWKRSKDL
ncbi:MAG: hypothetical protein M0P09_01420 [Acholeplasmataceae bacterium]|nr:hypothetical protein [Acholeplasmataceae bacterium]